MSEKNHIAIVEDSAPQRMILTRLLESEYEVSAFENGGDFLAATASFDAVLMDIEMPGVDGYETCRQLRARENGHATPVIFVSAHDTTPERVAAYEAGGDDFIIKPIAAHELRHKVKAMLEHRRRVHDLESESSTARQVAFTAMTTMGDLGVVIDFLRQTAQAADYESLGKQLIIAMRAWGLRGAVQIRGQLANVSLASDASAAPLQTTILDNLKDIGRIFEFGSRAVVNFAHVSLLVQNLPTHDPDKVGRLRDHLAVLAESADMRAAGMEAAHERDLQKLGIAGSLAELRETLAKVSAQNAQHRRGGQQIILDQLDSLVRTLGTLGLTENQESFVGDLVRGTLDSALAYFDEAAHFEDAFTDVLHRLERLAASDYRL